MLDRLMPPPQTPTEQAIGRRSGCETFPWLVGDVRGKHCLIVDDLVDTAGTLVKGVEALLDHGAKGVSACATHPVLSGSAVERISRSPIDELVVTNSIPLSEDGANCPKIRSLSVAPLLARAIQSIHEGGSISTLFMDAPSRNRPSLLGDER